MSSRIQNDSVIDDDDEFCPLCIEEFDLSDKNFKPCPCGYQICQFCYNNIKTHSEEGRCPNCRRVYDESTIQYKVPDVDEFKADLALKHRKAAAAKKKEAEKREIEASSRKNLAGVRVVQKNLVYVIGLNPTIRDENQLLQTLRGEQYFGQYGEIEKIVVSKAKPGGNPNQGIGVYVTFTRKLDAATCIAAVDGSPNGDRVLRAQYGTTKYCSSFLRNEQCNNRNCTFLHETGDDTDSFSRQDLSSMNTLSSQRVHANLPHSASHSPYTQSAQPCRQAQHLPYGAPPTPQPIRASSSKDGSGAHDHSALPSSASWANKDTQVHRPRRPSVAASRSSPSPQVAHAAIANKNEGPKRNAEKQPEQSHEATRLQTPTPVEASNSGTRQAQPQPASSSARLDIPALDELLKAVNSPDFRFVFSFDGLPAEDIAYIENHASLIDPFGGVKRRAMREKAEQERIKRETDARLLQSIPAEEENLESGSSQLGGEPDDAHSPAGPSGRSVREPQSAIQPPSQQPTNANSLIGSPVSAGHPFQGLNVNARSLTPLQQQQLMLLKGPGGQQLGLMEQLSGAASGLLDPSVQPRGALFQNQMPQMGGMLGHARQSSRFSFVNDSNGKASSNQRLPGQQTSIMPTTNQNPLNIPATQHGLGNQFFTSGVQGPPPGLKTAGTPPISGGGMFAQGHGFTSTMNNNLGLGAKQDGNAELMREFMRSRTSTSGASGVPSHEATKREFMFPFLQMHTTPPPLAPVSGLLNSFYGHQPGQIPDHAPQKQKKRGKKHRHANTSSGGGGVVDLADPSILQARMHQGAASATAAQGLYGSQGQADEDFPPLGPPSKPMTESHPFTPFRIPSARSGTPSLPPGLPLPHAHPGTPIGPDSSPTLSLSRPKSTASNEPSISPVRAVSTPLQVVKDLGISRKSTPDVQTSPALKTLQAKIATETSLGSPKPTTRSGRQPSSRSLSLSLEDQAPEVAPEPAPTPTPIAKPSKSRESTARPKPIKLNLALPLPSREASPTQVMTVGHNAANVNPYTSTIGSRPNTPATGISRTSESSLPRQPRVLRVVDTPKSETPPLSGPLSQSTATTPAIKRGPRRFSISSTSRPATPADIGSEYDPSASTSVSRASSPPPSKIGSAPVRAMTKSQVKKERKLKAKQAEAKKEEVLSVTPVAEEPIQAPIIGRKRKTKKAPARSSELNYSTDNGNEQSIPQKTEPSPVKSPVKGPKAGADFKNTKAKVEEKKEETDPWRLNNTLEQLMKDANATGATVKELFLERTSPLPVLLAELHQSGDLDLNTHPLFNPPNISQRVDMKCTADDYDMLKSPIELTEEHRKQLLRGEPVRINSTSDLLKHRCLITPTGCVLRHLSVEEEERYLALEKSLLAAWESLQEYPALTVAEPDVTNRGGGLDALFATPEKFNIRWVDVSNQPNHPSALPPPSPTPPAAPNVFSSLEADAARASGRTDTLSSSNLPPRSSPLVSNTVSSGNIVSDIEELMNMPDDELRHMIQTAQRELESSRKEVDQIDKKVTALVKRNKKLIQQALVAALECVGSPS
ncbi:hypothetical protein AJ80_00550 [Polytolypa hystricis UAMH7299]|uniref:RING-type domain-containing protein n=1 Tax=Polytolypa hystricis (strain UAMH7299) TaxID=1447883 RepID=A0A2B7Z3X8_POLH7|nr:hypothetical protein AJ80_00550 [Polytolypa hystricis UAMH7299]